MLCVRSIKFENLNVIAGRYLPLHPSVHFFYADKRNEPKKNRPHVIFLRWASFWGGSGKMIPVMHSGPQRNAGLHADATSCFDSAPGFLPFVRITSIKAPQHKIPKGAG
jgi:hypothetical protein